MLQFYFLAYIQLFWMNNGDVFFKIVAWHYLPLLYEITHGWNSEKIERRTWNVQHRTSNIDDATLYLILKQANGSLRRTQSYRILNSIRRRALRSWAQGWTTQPNRISKYKFALLRFFLNWQNTLFDVGRSMFDVHFLVNPSCDIYLDRIYRIIRIFLI